MNFLFEPVKMDGQSLQWTHGHRTISSYPGFYHWHQCMEMLFVHEGEGSVIVDQNAYELRRGMLFLFQPFQLHKIFASVTPDKPYKRSIAFFDPETASEGLMSFPLRHGLFMKLWQGRTAGPAYDLIGDAAQVESILAAYDEMHRMGRGQEREEIALLMLQLTDRIQAADKELGGSASGNRPLRYSERIMRWIEAHYAEEAGLEQLAADLHLSKYYVSRVFREETGSNLSDYLTARRIKHACRLLQSTTQSVEHIGMQVGYATPSYFISTFRKVMGTTPLKYRQRHTGD
ncbi:helix-turn-helix domain-containing protein [Paenibacillus arenilitoris]|uniref:Helix-turn-helix transcriptional regulator n=1 Tax=Paenibacillus arenilitoris TaxID=2772299 RepID=A0A927CH86_9BACL|nr:helix-turn-helix domain-containing protein [Paenibacillus arenilitoris]MBD2867459.1 helix-turn-helix transcriptional regulator [Paenibacillus arenilitoris]